MGNLKDELLRKGLLDEKRARQMAHEEKARKNRVGAEAVDQERRRAEEERVAKDHARRESDRRREQDRQAEEAARAARLALVQLVRDHALTQGMRGNKRWHFVTRAKKIPFLDVSDDAARRLENGHVAICEVPESTPEQFVLVPLETALKVRERAPEYVLFLNEAGAGARTRA